MAKYLGYGSNNNTIPFGRITVVVYSNSIKLCPFYNHPENPWNFNYVFTPLVANEVSNIEASEPTDRSTNYSVSENGIVVSTFFNDKLTIKNNYASQNLNSCRVSIINSLGQVIISQITNLSDANNSISTNQLNAGFYLVTVEFEGKAQFFKTFKQ